LVPVWALMLALVRTLMLVLMLVLMQAITVCRMSPTGKEFQR
jgi:hypothetical protein